MTPTETTATHPAQADIDAAEHAFEHHKAMAAEIERLANVLHNAPPEGRLAAHTDLAEWFQAVLVPHSDEEESMTYKAAAELPEGRLLVQAMVRDHQLIKRLVTLFIESEFTVAATYATAILEVVKSHQEKENESIIPLLLEAKDVSLSELVGKGHMYRSEQRSA